MKVLKNSIFWSSLFVVATAVVSIFLCKNYVYLVLLQLLPISNLVLVILFKTKKQIFRNQISELANQKQKNHFILSLSVVALFLTLNSASYLLNPTKEEIVASYVSNNARKDGFSYCYIDSEKIEESYSTIIGSSWRLLVHGNLVGKQSYFLETHCDVSSNYIPLKFNVGDGIESDVLISNNNAFSVAKNNPILLCGKPIVTSEDSDSYKHYKDIYVSDIIADKLLDEMNLTSYNDLLDKTIGCEADKGYKLSVNLNIIGVVASSHDSFDRIFPNGFVFCNYWLGVDYFAHKNCSFIFFEGQFSLSSFLHDIFIMTKQLDGFSFHIANFLDSKILIKKGEMFLSQVDTLIKMWYLRIPLFFLLLSAPFIVIYLLNKKTSFLFSLKAIMHFKLSVLLSFGYISLFNLSTGYVVVGSFPILLTPNFGTLLIIAAFFVMIISLIIVEKNFKKTVLLDGYCEVNI